MNVSATSLKPFTSMSNEVANWGDDHLPNISSYNLVHPFGGILVSLLGCSCPKLLIQEKISWRLSHPSLDITYQEDSPRTQYMVLQCAEAQGSTQNSGNTILSDLCLQLLFYESDSGHENVFILLQRDWWPFLIQSYFTSAFFFIIFKPCNWTNFTNTHRAFPHKHHWVCKVAGIPHCLSWNKLRNR